jgi:hypothetical protein
LSDNKKTITKWLEAAKRDYDGIGGWKAFKSGEWLWLVIPPICQRNARVDSRRFIEVL